MDVLKKCSSKTHEKNNAISYCQNCNLYLCNKCFNTHSNWFENHITYDLNKNSKDIYTYYCQEKFHSNILEYYCKTHNKLCCVSCISKIKNKFNGQHLDCDVYNIEEIKEEKIKKLKNIIEKKEELIQKLEKKILSLDEAFKKINENKNNLKLEVQKIFTIIRNEINKREDELLLKIDEEYDNNYLNEESIKEGRNLFKIIKNSLEKYKKLEEEKKMENSNEKNLISIINDFTIFENNLSKLNKIDSIKSNKIKLKFFPSLNKNNIFKINYYKEDLEEEEEEEEDINNNKEEKNENKDNNSIKIAFIGDQYSGKTSIINRYCENKFEDDNYESTIAVDFKSKMILLNDQNIKLYFYDTSEQEKFHALIPSYIKDAKIIIIVYDITNKNSFNNLNFWIKMIKKTKEKIIILVGSKNDLNKKRQVTIQEGENLAKEKGFLFYEVSSKNEKNINELFEKIIFPKMKKKFGKYLNLENNEDDIDENEESDINDNIEDEIYKRKYDKALNNFLKVINSFGILDYNNDNIGKN